MIQKLLFKHNIPNIILLKILSSVTRYYYIIHIYVIIYRYIMYVEIQSAAVSSIRRKRVLDCGGVFLSKRI